MATLAEKVSKFLEQFGAAGEEVLEKAAQNEKAADGAGLTSKEAVSTTETLKDETVTQETEVETDELSPEESAFAEALTEAIDERLQAVLPAVLAEVGVTETKEHDALAERVEKLELANTKLLKQNQVLANTVKELLGETPAGVKKFVASQSDTTKTKQTTKAAEATDPYDSFQEEFIGNFFMQPAQLNGRRE